MVRSAFVLIALLLAGLAAAPDWERVAPSACPFSVEMPGDVEVETDTLHAGDVVTRTHTYTASLDSTVFIASCSALPADVARLPGERVTAVLDQAIRRAAPPERSTYKRLTVQGHPARRAVEVLAFEDDPLVTHELLVYVRRHQVHLATGPYTSDADVERFLGSLRLRD